MTLTKERRDGLTLVCAAVCVLVNVALLVDARQVAAADWVLLVTTAASAVLGVCCGRSGQDLVSTTSTVCWVVCTTLILLRAIAL